MPTLTLLDKLYGAGHPETFEKLYSDILGGLEVTLRFVGTTKRGWIQLDVYGEDQTVAINLLKQEIGLAPNSLYDLKTSPVTKGKVIFSNKSQNELTVDLGVSSPTVVGAALSKKTLQAQLSDGKNIELPTLVELFCLYDNLPLEVRIGDYNDETKTVDTTLSEAQLSLFTNWVQCRFDRMIVLGSFLSDVEHAVKKSKSFRDIIKTESLGTLEQVVVCKLGTDAVGLIPKIGRYLKSAVLVPFSPKKVLKTIGSESFDWKL